MSAVHIVTLTIFFIIKICASYNVDNNACKNYNDYHVRAWSKRCYINPDVSSDTPKMIIRHDYPLESYTITTQDGYILTIFRIPPRSNKSDKQPVFLMPGILMYNAVWVYLGNRSLAFNLADKGYDVWLGNMRGSDYANTHRHYKISNKEYWNFSLDSLAYFDVGEQLKFIARKTRSRRSIIYIGHSMGSTLAFLYASGYPRESKNLLSKIIALSPILYFKDVPITELFKKIALPLERELDRLNIHGLFYQKSFNQELVQICSSIPRICKQVLSLFEGNLTDQFRPDDFLLLFSHCPSGTSVQVLKHYLQIIETGRVSRYDYGKLKNIEYYGLTEPRGYDMRYIRMPVYLFYGGSDALVSYKSVKTLFRELGSSRKELLRIPKQSGKTMFNHLDFLMAKDIKQDLYPEIFRAMQEHGRNKK